MNPSLGVKPRGFEGLALIIDSWRSSVYTITKQIAMVSNSWKPYGTTALGGSASNQCYGVQELDKSTNKFEIIIRFFAGFLTVLMKTDKMEKWRDCFTNVEFFKADEMVGPFTLGIGAMNATDDKNIRVISLETLAHPMQEMVKCESQDILSSSPHLITASREAKRHQMMQVWCPANCEAIRTHGENVRNRDIKTTFVKCLGKGNGTFDSGVNCKPLLEICTPKCQRNGTCFPKLPLENRIDSDFSITKMECQCGKKSLQLPDCIFDSSVMPKELAILLSLCANFSLSIGKQNQLQFSDYSGNNGNINIGREIGFQNDFDLFDKIATSVPTFVATLNSFIEMEFPRQIKSDDFSLVFFIKLFEPNEEEEELGKISLLNIGNHTVVITVGIDFKINIDIDFKDQQLSINSKVVLPREQWILLQLCIENRRVVIYYPFLERQEVFGVGSGDFSAKYALQNFVINKNEPNSSENGRNLFSMACFSITFRCLTSMELQRYKEACRLLHSDEINDKITSLNYRDFIFIADLPKPREKVAPKFDERGRMIVGVKGYVDVDTVLRYNGQAVDVTWTHFPPQLNDPNSRIFEKLSDITAPMVKKNHVTLY